MKKKIRKISEGDITFYRFDKEIGFWGIPSIEHYISYPVAPKKVFKAYHNKYGNRDEEVILNKNKQTTIFLGGSHTWGVAMDQENRYTDILKKEIPHNIINMGHCSLGLDQVYIAAKKKALVFNPNTLVVEQYPWSIHRIINTYVNGFCRPSFYFNKDNKILLNKVPSIARINFFRKILGGYYDFKKEFNEFKTNLNIKNNYNPETDPIFLLWHARYYDNLYNLAEAIIIKIKNFCIKQNIELLFLIGTVNQQLKYNSKTSLIDYDLPRKRFISILERQKIDYIDSSMAMLKNHTKTSPVAYSDGHINEKGNKILAKLLKEKFVSSNNTK